MEKKVRFHEIAHAKLIDIAKETPVGQKPQPTLLPRKRGVKHGFYENKIYVENNEHLVPVRLRPRKSGGLSFGKTALQSPGAPPSPMGSKSSKPPMMPTHIDEQRVVYPEPSTRPIAPRTMTHKWDEVAGAWKQERSTLGRIINAVSKR